ncbi:MAG: hypothetical protein GC136_10525 [Alphaproteobacteria bacterium]|nr:hypothetical protein [Alphaproteobacteria bacterium]
MFLREIFKEQDADYFEAFQTASTDKTKSIREQEPAKLATAFARVNALLAESYYVDTDDSIVKIVGEADYRDLAIENMKDNLCKLYDETKPTQGGLDCQEYIDNHWRAFQAGIATLKLGQ